MFRPLLCLVVFACAVGTAACRADADAPRQAAGSPHAKAPSGAPATTPSAACPSAQEIITAMNAQGWTGFKVAGPIVCDGGWVTTVVKLTKMASDPAHAVLRQVHGRWHGITYGTDGLCGAHGMHSAPPAIRKALGPYC